MADDTARDFDYSKLHPAAREILDDLIAHKMAKIDNGHIFLTLELDEEGFQQFFAVWKELKKKRLDADG